MSTAFCRRWIIIDRPGLIHVKNDIAPQYVWCWHENQGNDKAGLVITPNKSCNRQRRAQVTKKLTYTKFCHMKLNKQIHYTRLIWRIVKLWVVEPKLMKKTVDKHRNKVFQPNQNHTILRECITLYDNIILASILHESINVEKYGLG